MTGRIQETEAVFIVPSRTALEEISALLKAAGARTLSRPKSQIVCDVYVDTADRRVMQAGAALRFRTENGKHTLTLKSLDPLSEGMASRLERSEPLSRVPDRFPAPLPRDVRDEALCRLLGKRRLRVLFRIEQHRRVWRVATSRGAVLLVSADEVCWRLPRRRSLTGFRLELEFIEGPRAALAALVQTIRKRSRFPLAPRSKFEEGLHAAGIVLPTFREDPAWTLRSRDSFDRGARRLIGRQLARLLWLAPGAQLGLDPERLHAFRVAVRRLRSLLRWFRGALPERLESALETDLGWIHEVTGRSRDLDLFLSRLAEEDSGGRPSPLWRRRLQSRFETDAERARREASAALASARFARLLRRVQRWTRAELWGRITRTGPRRSFAREAAHRFRKVAKKSARKADRLRIGSAPTRYHRVRKAFKHLRYGLEPLVPWEGQKAARTLRLLERFQDLLGRHQDAIVAQTLLEEAIKAMPRLRGKAGAEIERFRRSLEKEARQARAAFRKAWEKEGARLRRKILTETLLKG